MTKPAEIKQEAFAQYCLDIPLTDICNNLNIRSRNTIYRWIEKLNWEEKKREILSMSKQYKTKDTNNLHIGVANTILRVYAEAVEKDRRGMQRKTSHRDAMEAVRLARLVGGESTENQDIKITFVEESNARDKNSVLSSRKAKKVS